MTYKYICNDPLAEKINYEYSPYLGQLFIDQWKNYRDKFRLNNQNSILGIDTEYKNQLDIHSEKIVTKDLIYFIKSKFDNDNKDSEDIKESTNWLIKRFELTKRIYTNYEKTERGGKGTGEFRDLSLYLDFAELLIKAYKSYSHLPSLNSLIKCLDIVMCYENLLNKNEKLRLSNIIKIESELFNNLRISYKNLINQNKPKEQIKQNQLINNFTKFPNVLFIAADTIRSRGYAQSLLKNGIRFKNSIFIKSKSNSIKTGKSNSPPIRSKEYINGIFNPDPQIPLKETLDKLSENIKVLESETINCKSIEEYLKNLKPHLIIYSGFGGEIVSSDLIDMGIPFLHLHAGILPSFRGSTTIYYSLLKTAQCGVSAILLSSQIDAGDIIKCKSYYPPDGNCNLDYEYDNAIRADLLVDVMFQYHENNFEIKSEKQKNNSGETYYVIHPLLKHLAILALN